MSEDFTDTIEKYKDGDTPIIVLTSTAEQYEEFLRLTNRTKEQAVAVKQPFQLAFYPNLEIVHYKDFWLNGAYGSLEYKERLALQALKDYENSGQ